MRQTDVLEFGTDGKPQNFNTDLPGDADGGESIGATGEELPFAQQQHPDVVLTLLLHTDAHTLASQTDIFSICNNNIGDDVSRTSDLPLLWHERFVSS